MFKKHSFLLFLFFIFFIGKWNISICQDLIGQSSVLNFNYDDIKAGTQTWMIAQDKFGIMYFGNSEGLLTYNGSDWNLYPLPNRTTLRSVKIAEDGKIYVGGQNEFGYFFPSENGTLIFHSLKSSFPKSLQSFGDAWNTTLIGKEIFFRCPDKIFHIDVNGKIEDFPTASEWQFLGTANGKILAQDKNKGLLYFDNHQWKSISAKINSSIITSVMSFNKDSILFTTLKDGVFLSSSKNEWQSFLVDTSIFQYHIYTATKINDNQFALGTTSNGVFIIDKNGKTIRHLSRNTQLQNNNVLSMFVDNQSNLWLGLDRGIDMVNNDASIQKINPVINTPSACYTAKIFHHILYIGTSDGLYSLPLSLSENEDLSYSKGIFTRVRNSGGQVWGLADINNKLLMGHNDGAFTIENNKAVPIYKGFGTWIFRAYHTLKSYTDILAGTYYSLNWMRLNNNKIADSGKIKNSLYESMRFLEIDSANNVIWSAHPYRGIYKIVLKDNTHEMQYSKLYTTKDGLPANLDNYVFSIQHQIVFCTEQGIYSYNSKTDRFEPNKYFQKKLGNIPIRFITEDNQNRLWFASQKKLGVVLSDKKIKYFPEITDKLIDGFEFIYPINDQNIFVGSVDGLIHINLKKYEEKQHNLQLLLSKVTAFNKKDSILFNGFFTKNQTLLDRQSSDEIRELPASFNSFHFEYTSPNYAPTQDIEYSYRLVGFEQDWSRWSNRNEKDYTNLPFGKYTFLVKARDEENHESKIVEYSFIIQPHWYQTKIADIIYILLFIAILIFIRKYQLNKFQRQKEKYEKEQAQLQYLHQLEIEHNENAIVQLQKEKLESEVAYKNKELASTTMHLFKRGKLLTRLKNELSEAIKKLPQQEQKSDFTKLVKMLNEAEKQDNDWEQFAIHFDDVYNNFLQNLKHAYPSLTQADLRICAYLKMNLSSKEIVQLLNISLKSIEIARYRLRKKLNLTDTNITLYDFLANK